ncbi:MAG: magnesium transporter, partial [Acholeplasmataceae bacterium]|nr:magnesium transporter [Acholeplasmataceae bacterium]
FLTISKETSIKDATAKIIAISKEQDYIDTIFVIDDKMIVGIIDLKQLIIARSTDHLEDIMVEDFHFIYEDESIEKAIQTIKDYDRNVIPVLSREDHLMGIVTADDIFDEIIESHDEDYHKLALVHDHDIDDSAFKRSSQRLPWLMIAVVLNLLIASFLSIFEATLAEVTALVLFQPLIMGMAGNIGTQSLAVTLLGLHVEELDNKKMPKKYIIKETFVGLFNSLSLGIASFIVAYGFLLLIPTGSQRGFDVAFIVFIAVFASMFISAIMGVLIPLTLNRLKVDPAVASGPIMTTINDVVALVIYFGIATIAFML